MAHTVKIRGCNAEVMRLADKSIASEAKGRGALEHICYRHQECVQKREKDNVNLKDKQLKA